MCGRLNISDEPLARLIAEFFGIPFTLHPGHDIRPTQTLATLTHHGAMVQQDAVWGFKPSWAKTLLINAQAETVASKPTFRQFFAERRCLVPCSGWYEWRDEGAKRKQRYRFSATDIDRAGFLMAGILLPIEAAMPAVVTLTTAANTDCAPYHHRMPLLIPWDAAQVWLTAAPSELTSLLLPSQTGLVQVEPYVETGALGF